MNSRYYVYLAFFCSHALMFGVKEEGCLRLKRQPKKEYREESVITENKKDIACRLCVSLARGACNECSSFLSSFFTKNHFQYKYGIEHKR